MDKGEELITIGQVINTQGNKGEVRVWPLTDYPDRFSPGSRFLLSGKGPAEQVTVEQARPQKNYLVVKFREIDDMNAAEGLKNRYLQITRDLLPPLPANRFYIFEIIGMQVYLADGRELGSVQDVRQPGGADIYLVAGEHKEYLIPAVKAIVKQIDRENRRMVIDPPEGLLDL